MDTNTAAVWFAAIAAGTVVSLVAVIACAVVAMHEIKLNAPDRGATADVGEGG